MSPYADCIVHLRVCVFYTTPRLTDLCLPSIRALSISILVKVNSISVVGNMVPSFSPADFVYCFMLRWLDGGYVFTVNVRQNMFRGQTSDHILGLLL